MSEKPSELEFLRKRVAQKERELREYFRVEEVLVAAGLVSKEKVEQAREIVRGLPHDQA